LQRNIHHSPGGEFSKVMGVSPIYLDYQVLDKFIYVILVLLKNISDVVKIAY